MWCMFTDKSHHYKTTIVSYIRTTRCIAFVSGVLISLFLHYFQVTTQVKNNSHWHFPRPLKQIWCLTQGQVYGSPWGCRLIGISWWRHQMEKKIRLTGLCAGNSPVTGEFPAQRPVTHSFDVFFGLRLSQQLSKHWRHWWFEMPPRSLWRHCNDTCLARLWIVIVLKFNSV